MSDNKAKDFTRGGQITFHNLRMLNQINKTVSKCYLGIMLLVTLITIFLITPHDMRINVIQLGKAYIFDLLGKENHLLQPTWQGTVVPQTAMQILQQQYFHANFHAFLHRALLGLGIACGVGLFFAIWLARWLTRKGRAQTEATFVRGTKLGTVKQVAKQLKREKLASDLRVDQMPLIRGTEVQHTLIHGTTGAGKGQLLMKLLDQLRKRGDKVILYDKGCSFTPIYFRETEDVLLNPFDSRCANWDLWSEALEAADFENMAESQIPMQGNDPFWVNAPRTIFASAAYTMQDDPDRSITKLLNLLMVGDLATLTRYLEGTEAAALADEKIEKTALSLRTVLTTYLKSLRYLAGLSDTNKPPFSIRNWINDESERGWLFISSHASQHALMRPLLSMWLSMASLSLLSLPENRNRRIWLIIDELPSLHKLPQLPETIAEVRKFGGCLVLGMQSYAQLEKVYGTQAAKEMFDLLNTRFFFRSPSAPMAKIVSEELGEQEIEEMRENYSYGANTIRDGISIGRQRVTRRVVSHPEIMGLADLQCYLRLPGNYAVVPLSLTLEDRPGQSDAFIRRTISPLTDLDEEITHAACRARKLNIPLTEDTAKAVESLNTKASAITAATSGGKSIIRSEELVNHHDSTVEVLPSSIDRAPSPSSSLLESPEKKKNSSETIDTAQTSVPPKEVAKEDMNLFVCMEEKEID